MNRRPIIPFVALAMLATSSIGFGQSRLYLWTDATYRQQSLTQMDFRGVGEFGVLLQENIPVLTTCRWNFYDYALYDPRRNPTKIITTPLLPINTKPIGSTAPPATPPDGLGPVNAFPPDSLTGDKRPGPCIYGANAYFPVSEFHPGSQRFGLGLPRYWEVQPIKPNTMGRIAAFQQAYTSFYAAPPSTLLRPMGEFVDESYLLPSQPFEVAQYRYGPLRYDTANTVKYKNGPAAGADMKSQIVPGDYIFHFPFVSDATIPVSITATHLPIPEGWSNQGTITSSNSYFGFRFTKLNGKPLVWAADGFVEIDPRMINTLEWEGNTGNLVFPAVDELDISIVDLGLTLGAPGNANKDPVNPTDPTLPPNLLFPLDQSPFPLPSPTITSYTFPPNITALPNPAAPTFQLLPISECILKLDLVRAAPSDDSKASYDVSERYYQLPVRYVNNTYAGWATWAFRNAYGLTAAARLPTADPDHDGYTNQQEFLLGTDPTNPNSHPAAAHIAFIQSRATRSTSTTASTASTSTTTPATGHWETSMTKAVVSATVSYTYEFSSDMQTWRSIEANDPDWQVIDTNSEIKLQSRSSQLNGTGFLRTKIVDTTPANQPAAQ
ncbi:MAG: hypothetical protein DVB25_01220 [Verrucomicrobia bacterium]|nr:MAG: hypothetical protein DVB25_01220 [Verrucomicrobiota bacterium]